MLVVRGDRPGLVHIISAMEACDTYKPWHDKHTHRTFLRPDTGKCLHYYFYFINAELGLIYLRVPTWCPFRLQFYCNGHSWLARQLTAAGVGFTLADNAFLRIDDGERAQALADTLSPDHRHRILDHYAQQCCPVLDVFAQSYHWSFAEAGEQKLRANRGPGRRGLHRGRDGRDPGSRGYPLPRGRCRCCWRCRQAWSIGTTLVRGTIGFPTARPPFPTAEAEARRGRWAQFVGADFRQFQADRLPRAPP